MSGIPEKNKKPGVFYALTNDGVELPVIDLSHTAFAFDLGEAELAASAGWRTAEVLARPFSFNLRLVKG